VTANLVERKTNLINQVEKLKMEIDVLKRPRCKGLVMRCRTGNAIHLSLDGRHRSERHDPHRRTAL
jgi:hypothetical protein